MAIPLEHLVVGQMYQLYDTLRNITEPVEIAGPYNADADSIMLVLWWNGERLNPQDLMLPIADMLAGESLADRYYFYPPGAPVPGAGAPVPGAPVPGAPAAGGAGGPPPVFTNAEQLLIGAEHIHLEKPEGMNSISHEEFNKGDEVVLIYEGGEHANPHIFKRESLLAYFNHVLGPGGPHGTQQIKNPNTNNVIIRKNDALPVPNEHGQRIFNNGIIIKTGVITHRYPLRSFTKSTKTRKSRRRQNRKSRRRNTRHRKNMY